MFHMITKCKTGIKIKKSNQGLFTKYCNGKVTQECIDKAKRSGNKKLIKRAVFAENSRKWAKKHQEGGILQWLKDQFIKFGNAQIAGDSGAGAAMAIASGYEHNPKTGKWEQSEERLNDPAVKALRDNLSVISSFSMGNPVDDVTALYNIIRHPAQTAKAVKGALSDAKFFIKNPKAQKVYHGSSQPFNLNEARIGSSGNIGVHVTPNKRIADTFADNGGAIMEAYIARNPDAVVPDIGSNDYRFLSNNFIVPAKHNTPGNMVESYYSLNYGNDNTLFGLLETYGANPKKGVNRYGKPIIETYNETVIPLRDEFFPNMSQSAKNKSEQLLAKSNQASNSQLNSEAAKILSDDGYKFIQYHNTVEGGGGTSYIVTDPNIFYIPKTSNTDVLNTALKGRYTPLIIGSRNDN